MASSERSLIMKQERVRHIFAKQKAKKETRAMLLAKINSTLEIHHCLQFLKYIQKHKIDAIMMVALRKIDPSMPGRSYCGKTRVCSTAKTAAALMSLKRKTKVRQIHEYSDLDIFIAGCMARDGNDRIAHEQGIAEAVRRAERGEY